MNVKIPEGKQRNNWAEAIFKYVVVDNIPKLKKH